MATDSTIPEELQALLTQLESARSELAEALNTDQEELPQRTKERAAKTEEFRRNYNEREKRHPSYEEFIQFFHETPEQQRVEAIDAHRKRAEERIDQLRAGMQPLLDRLRKPGNRDAFRAVDNLLPDMGLATVDRFIALVQNILQTSGVRRRGKRAKQPLLDNVKQQIRELLGLRFSHQQICDRLADSPRPSGAAWAGLTWQAPYKAPRYRPAVSAWISEQR